MKKLEEYVVSIPDFPEEGIIFRDVTSVLQDAEGLQLAVDTMQELVKDVDYDVVAGPESRGFIFGTPIAYNNRKPFVLIRKAGKLPRETVSISYDLEYGQATIEMHKDSIRPGQKVLIVDDLDRHRGHHGSYDQAGGEPWRPGGGRRGPHGAGGAEGPREDCRVQAGFGDLLSR